MIDLKNLAENERLLEIGRLAIEKTLVDMRNDRMSTLGRGNGLVIKEFDGSDSSIIRMGPETALRIGILAIAEYLEGVGKDESK